MAEVDEEEASLVELNVSCSQLINMDRFSLSDPMVVLYQKPPGEDWKEVGRTEMIKDTLDPHFVRSFKVAYHFEQLQYFRFVVYDIDDMDAPLEKQDLIGETICALSEIVSAASQTVTHELKLPSHPRSQDFRGYIKICAEEIEETNSTAYLHLAGEKLDKKDLFGKSDPFFVISRCNEQGEFVPVAKSEVVHKNLDPEWKPFEISMQKLCNNDSSRPVKVDVYDWNRSGKHELIGFFVTCVDDLKRGAADRTRFTLMNPKVKAKKSHYKGSGTILFSNFRVDKHYDFLDFIRGGCKINLVTAIDFTASNGNPMLRESLHFLGGEKPNEYLAAIEAVVEVLGSYDSDQRFPVYGFGAKCPWKNNEVSHCFALTKNERSPQAAEVDGLLGIREVYQEALKKITLYGPTIFGQVLQKAFELSPHCTQREQAYTIFLLLSDGVMDDIEATVDALVANNDRPISIIIVGLGKADFSKMEFLDADVTPLKSSWGEVAKRDIVQFIPFNDFRALPTHELAKAIFEEIPGQLLSYMHEQDFMPNDPVEVQAPPMPVPMQVEYQRATYAGIGGGAYQTQFANPNAFHQGYPGGQQAYQGERDVNGMMNPAAPYTNQDMRTSWFMPPAQQLPMNMMANPTNNSNNAPPPPGAAGLRQSYVPEVIGGGAVYGMRESNGFSSEFDNNAMRISAATHYDARYN